ncbi:MAG: hypothetical protein AAFX93_15345 [Verrucomicrobiota bacterium]
MSPPLPNVPLLVIDAASPSCFVGIWQSGQWLATAAPNAAALEGLFVGVDQCLCDANLSLQDIQGFAHNQGPGSILGIRLSAMAIRTWRALPAWKNAPVWVYGGLHFAAGAWALENSGIQPTVISEFRHGRWNLLPAGADTIRAAESEALADLPEPLIYLRQRKAWQEPPSHAIEWRPTMQDHAATLNLPGLLKPSEEPGVYVVEEATFAKWDAKPHQG